MNVLDSQLISKFLDMAEFFIQQEPLNELNGQTIEAASLKPELEQLDDQIAPIEEECCAYGIQKNARQQQQADSHSVCSMSLSEQQQELQVNVQQNRVQAIERDMQIEPLDIDVMLPAGSTELLDELPNPTIVRERKVSLHEFIAAEERKWDQQHSLKTAQCISSELRKQTLPSKPRKTLTDLFAIDLQHAPPQDYSNESRLDKLIRFYRKKQLRNWNRKISYRCRKAIADTRVRCRGRFVSKNEVPQSGNMDAEKVETVSDIKINQREESETTECPSHQ